jgi:predicted nuclease with TOPRIM domain
LDGAETYEYDVGAEGDETQKGKERTDMELKDVQDTVKRVVIRVASLDDHLNNLKEEVKGEVKEKVDPYEDLFDTLKKRFEDDNSPKNKHRD